MTTPEEIVNEARTWLGVRWRHQGRTRNGVDCAGLVWVVGNALGLGEYDSAAYSRQPDGRSFLEHFAVEMDAVPVAAAVEGDVMCFRSNRYPCHCAILSVKHDRLHIIHAYALMRGVFEEPLDVDWLKQRVAAFRFRGLAEV